MRFAFFYLSFILLFVWSNVSAAEPLAIHVSPGQTLHAGPDLSLEKSIQAKTPVLIYYANDFQIRYGQGVDSHVRRLIRGIENHVAQDPEEEKFLLNVGAFLLREIDQFVASVDIERDILIEAICSNNSRFNMGLAIFRNSGNSPVMDDNGLMARVGWEFFRPGDKTDGTTRKALEVAMGPKNKQDSRWWAQPYSASFMVFDALNAVQKEFPEDKFRYIFILKSLGDENHLVRPWFWKLSDQGDEKTLIAAILAARKDLAAEDGVTVPAHLGTLLKLNRVLSKDVDPDEVNRLSISKEVILEELARRGGGDPTRGMFFSAFFADTQMGGLHDANSKKLMKYTSKGDNTGLNLRNFGKYYFRQGAVGFHPMPYRDLIDQFGIPDNERHFDARFAALMKQLAQERKP